MEISGPAFAAPDTESVFTVTDTTGLQTLSWTATGPDDFTASSNGEQFALTTPTGGSYTITVTATDPEGDTYTATVTLSVLGDITGHQFADEIVWLAEQGITRGCSQQPLRYCPQDPVTRAQMATFLTRALNLQTPQQPAGFQDVNPASVHAPSIEALYAERITLGCAQQPLRYCPQDPVTRAQMATFLTRALNLQTPQQPAGFQDVNPASVHAPSIEALYADTHNPRLRPTTPALLPPRPRHPRPNGRVPIPGPPPHSSRQLELGSPVPTSRNPHQPCQGQTHAADDRDPRGADNQAAASSGK